MANFGNATEAGEGFASKVYTGIENFRVVSVCPNHEELKKLFGDKAKEDTYTLKNDKGVDQVKIVLHLDNEAEEGEPSIKTRLTFFVTKEERLSQTGKKQFINLYGENAWLPLDGSIPESMSWFNTEGSRPAFNGEDIFISFIRNLLNLPSLKKADKPGDAASQFSEAEWNAVFNGNFSIIKSAIMSSPNKIGLLLGAKTVDDGKIYQDIYNRSTLRQWSKASGKFDYLRKEVTDAQSQGSYPKTDFGNPDYILREYNPNAEGATNDSLFNQESSAGGSFFESETASTMGG